jgi:RNA polymerase sigma-70 factor (ECF subfamily)
MEHSDRPRTIDEVVSDERPSLVDLAFRMLGDIHEAEDVVQEAFSRLVNVGIGAIGDARGWLIVVVTRICLDVLRSARSRRETRVPAVDDVGLPTGPVGDPADRITLDDSVRFALLVVLERLTPPERAVFVLHDVFQFPFDTIAPIVGRTPTACRQLASRARRRIENDTEPARFELRADEHHRVAQQFIEACAGGDLGTLLHLLDRDVVGDVDLGPTLTRAPLRGRDVVARSLLVFFGPAVGRTIVSQPVNGRPGALVFEDRALVGILVFEIRDDTICDIHAIADRSKLALASRQLADHA